jgi:hypothetical protein
VNGWLMKVRHYSGAESVMSSHTTEAMAQEAADEWNTTYQTDNAYVEKFEREKLVWPSLDAFEDIIDKLRKNT